MAFNAQTVLPNMTNQFFYSAISGSQPKIFNTNFRNNCYYIKKITIQNFHGEYRIS